MAMSFNFVLSNNSTAGTVNAEAESETSLLSNSAEVCSVLFTSDASDCIDGFGGKDIFGTCDLSNMNQEFVADAGVETAGSVAFNGSIETMGSVASAGVETAGSVACGSSDSGSASCGGFSSFC